VALVIAIARTPANRSGPAAATKSATARMAMELTVCANTPNSAAMAEMVVRSIINRRNTCRAHRCVVLALGAASLLSLLVEHRTPTLRGQAAVAGTARPSISG